MVQKKDWYEITIRPVIEQDVDRVSYYLFEIAPADRYTSVPWLDTP